MPDERFADAPFAALRQAVWAIAKATGDGDSSPTAPPSARGEDGMIYILLNLVPIAVATAIGLALGAAYHRVSGARRPSPALIMAAFVAEFWLAAILAGALILAPAKADPWVMAIGSAVVIWAGFVMPALAVTLGHRGVSARRIAGDCGHWLLVMTTQAVAMKAIGLVPPPG